MNIRENLKEHGIVHLGWIIFVLALVIIGLSSWKLGTDDSVKDILNFAVALASLVLALLAIIQALLSGGELTNAVSEIRLAMAEIREPSRQLSEAALLLSGHSEALTNEAHSIRETADRLLRSSELLPASDSTAKPDSKFPASEVLPALNESGKATLYLILRSFETKKGLPAAKAGVIREVPMSWSWGYVSALSNLSVIGVQRSDETFVVTDLGRLSWLPQHRAELGSFLKSVKSETHSTLLDQVDAWFDEAKS